MVPLSSHISLVTGAHGHTTIAIDSVGQVEGEEDEHQLNGAYNGQSDERPLPVRVDPIRDRLVAAPVLITVRVAWRVRALPVHENKIFLVLEFTARRRNCRVLHRDPLVRLLKVLVAVHAAAAHLQEEEEDESIRFSNQTFN